MDEQQGRRWSAPEHRDRLVCAALALAPFLILAPHLFGGPIAPGDGWVQNLPAKFLAASDLRHGHFPGWTGAEFGGARLFAAGHFGIFYPPNLLLVAWPSALAYNLVLVSNLSISAVGSYLLGRRVLRDRVAALLVAVAFGLGPFRWRAPAPRHVVLGGVAALGRPRRRDRSGARPVAPGGAGVRRLLRHGHPRRAPADDGGRGAGRRRLGRGPGAGR